MKRCDPRAIVILQDHFVMLIRGSTRGAPMRVSDVGRTKRKERTTFADGKLKLGEAEWNTLFAFLNFSYHSTMLVDGLLHLLLALMFRQ